MGYSVLRGRQSGREKCVTRTGAGCVQQASASAPIKVKQRVAYRHRRCITRAGVGRHRVGGRLGGRVVAHTVQEQNRSTLWSSLLHSTLATVLHVGLLAHARHEERRWFVTRHVTSECPSRLSLVVRLHARERVAWQARCVFQGGLPSPVRRRVIASSLPQPPPPWQPPPQPLQR
jgi:hypothetical protein